MKYYRKNDANTKVRILKPILDDWNDCITDTWMVEKEGDDNRRVIVRRKNRGAKVHENIHGSLVHELACVCEAYDWCWAIYVDDEFGLHLHI